MIAEQSHVLSTAAGPASGPAIASVHYEEYDVPEMDNNPLIGALKRPTDDVLEQLDRLSLRPQFSEAERSLPASIRVLLLNRLRENFFFPTDSHVRIYKETEAQVFAGYWSRNPTTAAGQRLIHNAAKPGKQIECFNSMPGTGASISFWVGPPGQGKSSLVRAIGRAIAEPVIRHSLPYGIIDQIVTLTRNFTDQPNCTPKAIAKLVADRVDEMLGVRDYGPLFRDKSMSRTHYVSEMRRILSIHWVGALVLDVFENVSLLGTKGTEELIALLVNLKDELGVPLILIGTYKAAKILESASASVTRRFVDGGLHELKRPQSEQDVEFRAFCDVLWRYQWVRDPIPLDPESSMYRTLFDLSQGITAVLLLLFRFAQLEAIRTGKESVTEEVLKTAYNDKLFPLHRILNALRTPDKALLNQYDDLYLRAFSEVEPPPIVNRLTSMVEQMKQLGAAGEGSDTGKKASAARQKAGGADGEIQQLAQRAVAQMDGMPADILK